LSESEGTFAINETLQLGLIRSTRACVPLVLFEQSISGFCFSEDILTKMGSSTSNDFKKIIIIDTTSRFEETGKYFQEEIVTSFSRDEAQEKFMGDLKSELIEAKRKSESNDIPINQRRKWELSAQGQETSKLLNDPYFRLDSKESIDMVKEFVHRESAVSSSLSYSLDLLANERPPLVREVISAETPGSKIKYINISGNSLPSEWSKELDLSVFMVAFIIGLESFDDPPEKVDSNCKSKLEETFSKIAELATMSESIVDSNNIVTYIGILCMFDEELLNQKLVSAQSSQTMEEVIQASENLLRSRLKSSKEVIWVDLSNMRKICNSIRHAMYMKDLSRGGFL
jgi:hypothetical protein